MSQAKLEHYTKVKVVGVGGGGGNAVNRMIESGVSGVEFIVMNTDVQALDLSLAPTRLQIGDALTKGLGVGGNPAVGRNAAEESRQDIRKLLEGSDMVFITAGMGGGTGTGAAPIVAEIARDLGALTVGVVTKPFGFEGPRRARLADEGIAALTPRVDTVIVVPNDRLLTVAERRAKLTEAFHMADDVVRQGVQGISDIVTIPGLINIDFADVKAIMSNAGTAIMGIGSATGERRAVEAAELAISSPLLESSIEGARGVLLNISAGSDLTLDELYEAANVVSRATDAEDAFIITGCVIDETLGDEVRVTVLATGYQGHGRPGDLFRAEPQPSTTQRTPSRPPIQGGSGNSPRPPAASPPPVTGAAERPAPPPLPPQRRPALNELPAPEPSRQSPPRPSDTDREDGRRFWKW